MIKNLTVFLFLVSISSCATQSNNIKRFPAEAKRNLIVKCNLGDSGDEFIKQGDPIVYIFGDRASVRSTGEIEIYHELAIQSEDIRSEALSNLVEDRVFPAKVGYWKTGLGGEQKSIIWSHDPIGGVTTSAFDARSLDARDAKKQKKIILSNTVQTALAKKYDFVGAYSICWPFGLIK